MATQRFIQRHSLQTRITHDAFVVACMWLVISGLFVFIPPLAEALPDVARFMRISHRVVGCIFIAIPIISAIIAPGGAKEFFAKYFTKWTPEDVTFVLKFVPYMLMPKKVHMPDQDEVKSGQRIADGMLMLCSLMMAISGVVLWLGTSVFHPSAEVLMVMRLVHDVFFLVLVIFVIAHVFLGAGIFQPYRGMVKVMFGNGQIAESDALYHWGFWARKELEDGKDIVERDIPDSSDKK